MSNIFPAVRRVQALKRLHPGEHRLVPKTRFSEQLSAHRVVLLVTLDMGRMRAAKLAVEGATINDAVVTVVAGAMRRYLKAKKELPDSSMTTVMPVNIRTEAEKNTTGNVVSITTLDMHTDIADPLKRLKAIHDSAVYSKAYHSAVGARIMSDVAESLPAGLMSAGARVAASAGVMKIPANTIVTNVPGPQVPLFLAGAKMIEFHALGILLDGLGLFHAVNSYCGRISFTVIADRKMLPDPDFYEQCLRGSYDELMTALAAFTTPPPAAATSAPSVAKPAPRRAANKAAK